MSEKEKQSLPINIPDYQKSNFLISAQYKSTLLENQLLAISLANAQRIKTAEDNVPYSEITVSELRSLLGVSNRGSFYDQLREAAESMTAKKIGMTSADSKTFDYLAVVIRATCENGIFTIKYNPDLKKYLTEIEKNYALLSLKTMLSFKNNYSFRLYEILKAKAYNDNREAGVTVEGENLFHIQVSTAELRLELGVVNSDLDSVQRVLRKQKYPDFDRAVDVAAEKMYAEWKPFRRRVIDPAVKGINETEGCDISVSYDTVKAGQGGKVRSIIFHVVRIKEQVKANEQKEAPANPSLTVEERDDFVDLMADKYRDLLAIKLSEVRLICEEAGYDAEKIEAAVECLKGAGEVKNVIGFLRSAIKNNWETPKEYKNGKKSKLEEYKNYPQNKYDFEKLEEALVQNDVQSGAKEQENALLGDLRKGNKLIRELKLSDDELRLIAEAAEYDIARIEKATACLKAQGKANNAVLYLIKAIENNWEPAKSYKRKSDVDEAYRNFKERDYDYDELKEKLLAK